MEHGVQPRREEAEPDPSSRDALRSERHAQQQPDERREEGAFSRLVHGVRALASRLSNSAGDQTGIGLLAKPLRSRVTMASNPTVVAAAIWMLSSKSEPANASACRIVE